MATAVGFIPSSPASTELVSTRTPQPPRLDPLPRKDLKVLEKAKFINYTYLRIGWKSTLKERSTQKSSNQNGPKKSQE